MSKKILLAAMGLVVLFACNEQNLAEDAGNAELKSGKANYESVTKLRKVKSVPAELAA